MIDSNADRSKAARIEEIGELCDDLVEHLVEGERAEALAAADAIRDQVHRFFGGDSD